MSAKTPAIEHLAERVAQLLGDRLEEALPRLLHQLDASAPPPAPPLVDAATLARELGVTRSFVYDHADELAAVRIGVGKRPRLRFDVARARAALAGSLGTPEPPPARRATRRAKPVRGVELLPVKGDPR